MVVLASRGQRTGRAELGQLVPNGWTWHRTCAPMVERRVVTLTSS